MSSLKALFVFDRMLDFCSSLDPVCDFACTCSAPLSSKTARSIMRESEQSEDADRDPDDQTLHYLR